MSIPPINPFAGMAASHTNDAQRQVHSEREQSQQIEKLNSQSETDAQASAPQEASDRDADGRQDWHQKEHDSEGNKNEDRTPTGTPPRNVDHERGNFLDLDG